MAYSDGALLSIHTASHLSYSVGVIWKLTFKLQILCGIRIACRRLSDLILINACWKYFSKLKYCMNWNTTSLKYIIVLKNWFINELIKGVTSFTSRISWGLNLLVLGLIDRELLYFLLFYWGLPYFFNSFFFLNMTMMYSF